MVGVGALGLPGAPAYPPCRTTRTGRHSCVLPPLTSHFSPLTSFLSLLSSFLFPLIKSSTSGVKYAIIYCFFFLLMDFTHLDSQQRPTMVDVSGKTITERTAVAECYVHLGEAILTAFAEAGWASKKGPILDTAVIAGTMGAKRTSDLIPFCHPLNLKSVKIEIHPADTARLRIEARVKVTDQTGVEMEALTAASVAALTIYDMCKSASKEIRIEGTRLIQKTGGKSDFQSTT